MIRKTSRLTRAMAYDWRAIWLVKCGDWSTPQRSYKVSKRLCSLSCNGQNIADIFEQESNMIYRGIFGFGSFNFCLCVEDTNVLSVLDNSKKNFFSELCLIQTQKKFCKTSCLLALFFSFNVYIYHF